MRAYRNFIFSSAYILGGKTPMGNNLPISKVTAMENRD